MKLSQYLENVLDLIDWPVTFKTRAKINLYQELPGPRGRYFVIMINDYTEIRVACVKVPDDYLVCMEVWISDKFGWVDKKTTVSAGYNGFHSCLNSLIESAKYIPGIG